MFTKVLGYSKFKAKKSGNDLISFTVIDQRVQNPVGTCCTNILGNQSDFPDCDKMVGKDCLIDCEKNFASGYHEIK